MEDTDVDWKQRRAELRPWRDILLSEPCVYCGRAPKDIMPSATGKPLMTIEHILPRHLTGGRRRHHWDNEAPACWNCNHNRGCTPFIVFLVQREEKRRHRELTVRWGNLKAHLAADRPVAARDAAERLRDSVHAVE